MEGAVESDAPLPDTPIEVAEPETQSPPTLGPSESDGLLEIAPPQAVIAPTTPITATPEPITVVVPPHTPHQEMISAFTGDEQEVECLSGWLSWLCWYPPSDIESGAERTRQEIDGILGDNPDEDLVDALDKLTEHLDNTSPGTAYHEIRSLALALAKFGSTAPGEALLYTEMIESLVSHGMYSGDTLLDLVYQSGNSGAMRLLPDYDDITEDDLRRGLSAFVTHASYTPEWRAIMSERMYYTLGMTAPEGMADHPIGQFFTGEGYNENNELEDRIAFLDIADIVFAVGGLSKGLVSSSRRGALKAALKEVGDCFWRQRNSFSRETVVATASGLAAISTITVGQEVYAYNETIGEVGLHEITEVHEHVDPMIINLTIDSDLTDDQPGVLIETTPEHPFFVDGEWVSAGDLVNGMKLTRWDGEKGIETFGIVTDADRIETEQTMYNLTVDEAHTFFVGEDKFLVHNTNTSCIEWQRLLRVSQDYEVLRSQVPIKTAVGSGDIDLVVRDNGVIRLAEVGGASKTPQGLGTQLKKLELYADQHGGVPTFFYDNNTSQQTIDYAVRRLGESNVLPIPRKRF